MAGAKITLTLTAAEFDLIRECVKFRLESATEVNKDTDQPAKTRADARMIAGRLSDIQSRILT